MIKPPGIPCDVGTYDGLKSVRAPVAEVRIVPGEGGVRGRVRGRGLLFLPLCLAACGCGDVGADGEGDLDADEEGDEGGDGEGEGALRRVESILFSFLLLFSFGIVFSGYLGSEL